MLAPELRVEWTRVGPSEDTLQRVLPFILERVGLDSGALCFSVCKSWQAGMNARAFCNKTVQVCATLAEDRDGYRLRQNQQRRLDASG
jgi:hypothetical protein